MRADPGVDHTDLDVGVGVEVGAGVVVADAVDVAEVDRGEGDGVLPGRGKRVLEDPPVPGERRVHVQPIDRDRTQREHDGARCIGRSVGPDPLREVGERDHVRIGDALSCHRVGDGDRQRRRGRRSHRCRQRTQRWIRGRVLDDRDQPHRRVPAVDDVDGRGIDLHQPGPVLAGGVNDPHRATVGGVERGCLGSAGAADRRQLPEHRGGRSLEVHRPLPREQDVARLRGSVHASFLLVLSSAAESVRAAASRRRADSRPRAFRRGLRRGRPGRAGRCPRRVAPHPRRRR
jgi:hypothetical protein